MPMVGGLDLLIGPLILITLLRNPLFRMPNYFRFLIACLVGLTGWQASAAITYLLPSVDCSSYAAQLVHQHPPPIYPDTNFQIDKIRPSSTFHVYRLNSQSLLNGKLLEGAEIYIRQYRNFFLLCETNVLGFTGIHQDAAGKWETANGCVYFPPQAARMWTALQTAEKLPQVHKQDYELRFIMDTHLWAIWLHGQSDDIILPVDSQHSKAHWLSGHPYSPSELMKLIELPVDPFGNPLST
jgi:hypothetical protein